MFGQESSDSADTSRIHVRVHFDHNRDNASKSFVRQTTKHIQLGTFNVNLQKVDGINRVKTHNVRQRAHFAHRVIHSTHALVIGDSLLWLESCRRRTSTVHGDAREPRPLPHRTGQHVRAVCRGKPLQVEAQHGRGRRKGLQAESPHTRRLPRRRAALLFAQAAPHLCQKPEREEADVGAAVDEGEGAWRGGGAQAGDSLRRNVVRKVGVEVRTLQPQCVGSVLIVRGGCGVGVRRLGAAEAQHRLREHSHAFVPVGDDERACAVVLLGAAVHLPVALEGTAGAALPVGAVLRRHLEDRLLLGRCDSGGGAHALADRRALGGVRHHTGLVRTRLHGQGHPPGHGGSAGHHPSGCTTGGGGREEGVGCGRQRSQRGKVQRHASL
eukprot:Rhum_TRINITY_DN15461_c4_g2::Rhum_TRINITY_DN15461_c4_g2_i1::g.158219::m.158219